MVGERGHICLNPGLNIKQHMCMQFSLEISISREIIKITMQRLTRLLHI